MEMVDITKILRLIFQSVLKKKFSKSSCWNVNVNIKFQAWNKNRQVEQHINKNDSTNLMSQGFKINLTRHLCNLYVTHWWRSLDVFP